jgi:CTD small phosphatase-like protein 2
LVHCIDDIESTYFDLPISVKFPTGETIEAGINVRPFAYECLKIARENYQVVIFTASHKAYADVVLDTLEKEFKKEKYLTLEES